MKNYNNYNSYILKIVRNIKYNIIFDYKSLIEKVLIKFCDQLSIYKFVTIRLLQLKLKNLKQTTTTKKCKSL